MEQENVVAYMMKMMDRLEQQKPRFTALIQHKGHLKEDAAPRRKCYKIPEWLVLKLKKEIDLMLQLLQPVSGAGPLYWSPRKRF